MGVEQHAEAAAKELTDRFPFKPFPEEQVSDTREMLRPHMQAAIDEATAASLDLLQKTMTESDAKDRTIERQALRIATLEGLGPLIQKYGEWHAVGGVASANENDRLWARASQNVRDVLAKIDAILKGGAS